MRAHRIAFLLPHFRTGGAERVVLNWLAALERRHWQPVLMLGRTEGDLLPLVPADVPVVPLGGGRAMYRSLRIARALSAHRIACAYSATSAMNLALLAAPTSVPRIVSEHTPPEAFRRASKWPLLRQAATRLLTGRAAAVAVPTAAIARQVRGNRATVVVRNPVLREAPPPLWPKRLHGTDLVAAGRLVSAKGFDTLIAAAALLAAEERPFTLTIHGEGPLHDALASQIAAEGLSGRVTLAGHTPDLRAALLGADLLISSSRREGFGNVLIEAMALGTPVLATRAGGPETFIEHGINGFLTEPEHPSALARAIAELLDDPERRLRVRAAARETAAQYTVSASVQELTALIERVLARSTAA